MSEVALERRTLLLPFRWLVVISLGLAALAWAGGRHLYKKQGGYRPLALMHVPQTLRYRARVEIRDPKRAPLIAPLLTALDRAGTRRAALDRKLGTPIEGLTREVAFGVGTNPSDFVLVLGLQLQAETGLHPARVLCEVLSEDGIHSDPTQTGCQLRDGSLVAQTPEGALLLASRRELVKDLLGRPEIGDRLGFSGPSVRGAAPELGELEPEARSLAATLAAKYP